jgi:hypothetical protein
MTGPGVAPFVGIGEGWTGWTLSRDEGRDSKLLLLVTISRGIVGFGCWYEGAFGTVGVGISYIDGSITVELAYRKSSDENPNETPEDDKEVEEVKSFRAYGLT